MKIEVIKFKNKQLNSSEWIEEEVTRFGHKIIYRKNLYKNGITYARIIGINLI